MLPPWPPVPSLAHGFESDRSSVLTALLVLSLSDRSEGFQYSWHSMRCRETGAHMKINLLIFKDEDVKDAITYQSWRWDLTVYHHVGCRDCTFLPYAIILARVPKRTSSKLGDGYNLRQCAYHTR